MDLPHSDACLVQAYAAETTETFCEGHDAAFRFFGNVPQWILYENTTPAVADLAPAAEDVSDRTDGTGPARPSSFRIAASKSPPWNGFLMKLAAPALMARTARDMSPWPAIMIVGN